MCKQQRLPKQIIQATLDFLNWVSHQLMQDVTPWQMRWDSQLRSITFTEEYNAENPLIQAANDVHRCMDNTSVAWCFTTMPSEELEERRW